MPRPTFNGSAATPAAPAGPEKIDPQLLPLVVPIASLVPDPDNARLHGDRNMAAICESLKRFGQKTALVVRKQDRKVAAGNGRLAAAKQLGWTRIAASFSVMTDAEFAAYALADNRTAELAAWDSEVVGRLEALLAATDPGLVIGWTADELASLRAQGFKPRGDPDRIPEAPVTPASRAGDIWALGDHRLLCGDAADPQVIQKLMGKARGCLMATDPPYGVEFGKANHNPTAKQWGAVTGDDRAGADLRAWLTDVLKKWIPWVLQDSAFYVWSASLGEGHRFYEAMIDAGIHVQSQVVWAKNVFAMGQADYQWKHEPAWYGFFKGKKHRWYGGRAQTTVWEIKRLATGSYLHPMQKPVELYEIPIENHTKAGDVVVDPFVGSGTQFVAAHRLGRVCYGVDLDPKFCDVALQRFLDFTGIDPVRLSDKARFSTAKAKVTKRGG